MQAELVNDGPVTFLARMSQLPAWPRITREYGYVPPSECPQTEEELERYCSNARDA